jgi:hypothetical protein
MTTEPSTEPRATKEDRFRDALYAILGDPNDLAGRSRWTRYLFEPVFHAEVYEKAVREVSS